MKILKRLVAVMAIMAMTVSVTACGGEKANSVNATQNETSEGLVAKIDDIEITKTDLENIMYETDYYLAMSYGSDFKENEMFIPTYNQILEQNVQQLIGYEILVMKAQEREDITVTEDEINTELETIKANFESEEAFKAALDEAGITLDIFKENIESDLYYKKIVEDYKTKAEVSDDEVKEYYTTYIDSYTQNPGATISHILVDSEEKANEVLEKYNAGTSFADLAAEYGTDGTATTGGSLGYIPYDTQQYDADFMAAASKLGEGEVSAPVHTQFGWHLIKADGIQKEAIVTPFEDVKDQIKEQLLEQRTNENISNDVEALKANYTIEVYPENYEIELPQASDEAAKVDEEADSTVDGAADSTTESTSTTENK